MNHVKPDSGPEEISHSIPKSLLEERGGCGEGRLPPARQVIEGLRVGSNLFKLYKKMGIER
jgi:hypothetical protein